MKAFITKCGQDARAPGRESTRGKIFGVLPLIATWPITPRAWRCSCPLAGQVSSRISS